jgi:ribosomal protein S19E (S16A)
MKTTMLQMTYLGNPHLILLVAKSLRKPFSTADLKCVTPRLAKGNIVRKELTRLHGKGLLARSGDRWILTEKGNEQLLELAKRSFVHKQKEGMLYG